MYPFSQLDLPMIYQAFKWKLEGGKIVSSAVIVPARVRSTTGRYCFHRCLSVHIRGVPQWLVPGPFLRVPRPGPDRGYPSQVQMGEGVPWPGPDGGVLGPGVGYSPVQGFGTPLARSGWEGVPWSGVAYPPPPSSDRVPPRGIGQQMEYLIRGRRYASCVHAWGLSCLSTIFQFSFRECDIQCSYPSLWTWHNILHRRRHYIRHKSRCTVLTKCAKFTWNRTGW